ncbi:MAG: hypothetical protein ACE5JA_10485 [bacterium]
MLMIGMVAAYVLVVVALVRAMKAHELIASTLRDMTTISNPNLEDLVETRESRRPESA